jgi:hypothetical protein
MFDKALASENEVSSRAMQKMTAVRITSLVVKDQPLTGKTT